MSDDLSLVPLRVDKGKKKKKQVSLKGMILDFCTIFPCAGVVLVVQSDGIAKLHL